LGSRAATAVRRGRHAEPGIGVAVNSAARSIASAESSAAYRFAALELALQPFALSHADILGWRQPEQLLELPLEMIWTEARCCAEQFESDAPFAGIGDVIVDVVARPLDRGV